MSIREIMANSSLGGGKHTKEKGEPLNWDMVEPQVPGPDLPSKPEEKPAEKLVSSTPEINPADLSDTEVLDNFLLTFFALWRKDSKPSDYQLHQLAVILGCTPEKLEEHIYNMLGRIADSDEIDSQDI